MPGWHARTRDAVEDGRLTVVGITEEQHPDRCRLFMQWQQMDWPVLVDAANRLDVSVVPITLLIDESGTIRAVNPSEADLAAFLAAPPVNPAGETGAVRRATRPPDLAAARATAAGPGSTPLARRAAADELVTWAGQANAAPGDLDLSIEAYRATLATNLRDGRAWFRLGVALRHRADGPQAGATDFADAIAAWRTGLDLNPNQYIWRRRIQQYGPRLDKPYPFYDWVEQARAAIVDRGETPHPLGVEPRGAELARPQRPRRDGAVAAAPASTVASPDPDGRIIRDNGLVRTRVTVVRDTRDRGTVRVHLRLDPNASRDVWWNNEVDAPVLHLEPMHGVTLQHTHLEAPLARGSAPETHEPRELEFEATWDPAVFPPGTAPILRGHLLYFVCEGREGTCVYRRQDLALDLSSPSGSRPGAVPPVTARPAPSEPTP